MRVCRPPDFADSRTCAGKGPQSTDAGSTKRQRGHRLADAGFQFAVHTARWGNISKIAVLCIQHRFFVWGDLMVEKWQQRQVSLIGEEKVRLLGDKRVLICGLGGVGGSCCEALCRGGVGTLILIDCDVVDKTNINRQAFATTDTVGKRKVEAAKERLLSINPSAHIILVDIFLDPVNIPVLIAKHAPDYIIDAIDNVTAKVALAKVCAENRIPIISSMGTGNKLNPEMLKISDIKKTSVCPLARVMRRKLREVNINHLTVLWSDEEPASVSVGRVPASISTVPPAAGILIAGRVIRDLINT